jgi:hypothetical protein
MACAAPIIFTPLRNNDIAEAEAQVWIVYTVATANSHPRHRRWCVHRPYPVDTALMVPDAEGRPCNNVED